MAPSNYTQMKDQLMIFREVTKIFFGSESKLPESLKEVCKVIVSNASCLKYKCKDDKLLPAKIFFGIDEEIQRWLEQCELANDREEVDDSILENLSTIIHDVLRSRFNVTLPKAFKLEQSKPAEDESTPTAGPSASKKRKLSDDNKKGNRVVNEDPDEELKLKDDEDWKSVFCGTKKASHRVAWNNNGCKMCPRWHSRHWCFDNCNHKESHVPKSQVSAENKADYKKYLEKIRTS